MVNYAQLQQLRAMAASQIEARLAELMPSSGRGITVNDGMITMAPSASVPKESPPDDWQLVVFGRLKVTFGDEREWSSWSTTAGVFRQSGSLWSNYFWEATQLIAIPPVEGHSLQRSFKLELQTRGVRRRTGPGVGTGTEDMALLETSEYYLPIRLVLGEYDTESVGVGEPIRTHTIDIRRAVVSRTFTPSAPTQFTELFPISIIRI